jgi:hypothetical protein
MILLLVGGMALLGGFLQKMRAGRLANTPFAPPGEVGAKAKTIADPKGTISTYGQMQTQQLLTSPISGAQCVYYQMRLEAEWPDKGVEQKHKVMEEQQSVPFAVGDATGHVVVSINAKRGGEFCSAKPFTRKKFSRGLMATMGAKPLEVTPNFAIPSQLQVPGPLGRMIDVPLTANFFVTEEYLEPKGNIYVNGKVQDDGSIGSPSWASLLIQDKTREELLGASAGLSKKALLGGAIATPIGVALTVIGMMMAPSTPAAAPAAPAQAAMMPTPTPAIQPVAPPVVATGVTNGLTLGDACSTLGLNFQAGIVRVGAASDGLNVTGVLNGQLSRVFVKLGTVTAGQTVPVCAIGRRCNQNLQISSNSTVFINTGHVGGTITVNEYDVATGRMNLTFNGVTLPMNQGAGNCTISGSFATTGLSQ